MKSVWFNCARADRLSTSYPLTASLAAPGKEGRNMDHFCFRVEPFDEAGIRHHLKNNGVEAEPTSSRYGAEGKGPSIYMTDPEGNVVELKGPPDAKP
jgi:glyoxylase I family protein